MKLRTSSDRCIMLFQLAGRKIKGRIEREVNEKILLDNFLSLRYIYYWIAKK